MLRSEDDESGAAHSLFCYSYIQTRQSVRYKQTAIVAYLVHVMFLNFTKKFCSFFFDHGHSVFDLLPASTLGSAPNGKDFFETVNVRKFPNSSVFPLCDEVSIIALRDARSKFGALREAMHDISATLT